MSYLASFLQKLYGRGTFIIRILQMIKLAQEIQKYAQGHKARKSLVNYETPTSCNRNNPTKHSEKHKTKEIAKSLYIRNVQHNHFWNLVK